MSNQSAAVINTPEGIAAYRLLSLRGMLRMEKAGMKTRGGALRPRIAAELGLKARDSHDTFITEIERRLEELKPKAPEHGVGHMQGRGAA
jgi:hypothetical protein